MEANLQSLILSGCIWIYVFICWKHEGLNNVFYLVEKTKRQIQQMGI